MVLLSPCYSHLFWHFILGKMKYSKNSEIVIILVIENIATCTISWPFYSPVFFELEKK